MKSYLVKAAFVFEIEASEPTEAYRRVRDMMEMELEGTEAEGWDLEITVRPIAVWPESEGYRVPGVGEIEAVWC